MTRTARRRLTFHPLTVAARRAVAFDGSAVALDLEVPPDLADTFDFEPGQHVTVRALLGGREERRPYSVCVSPQGYRSTGLLTIGVRARPGGTVSRHLASLAPGARLDVMPPVGRLGGTRGEHVGALVAGSGITPVLSVARATLEGDPSSSVAIVYASHDEDSAMFLDELSRLKNSHLARLAVVHSFSARPGTGTLHGGRQTGARLARTVSALGPPDRTWVVCGPPAFVTVARDALGSLGVPASSVHAQPFVHARPSLPAGDREAPPLPPGPHSGGTRRLTTILDGQASACRVEAGAPLLDAALRARPDLPHSCRTGVCTSCRARLVEGRVEMRSTQGLSQKEIEAGYVLACQAVALSPSVTLDFDAP